MSSFSVTEGEQKLKGEDRAVVQFIPHEITEKKLTIEDASYCLNMLGKDETGSRYAFLALSAPNKNLTDISVILKFKHLLFLNLTGNYLTLESLQCLVEMPFLIILKVDQNRVETTGLNPMSFLQTLNLNKNQIKSMIELNQPSLEVIDLNFNDIRSIDFEPNNIPKMKQISLRGNNLLDLDGCLPVTLERLYLPTNTIAKLRETVLSKLPNLQILHLRENEIVRLKGFNENLKNLRYLNLRNNRIAKFREFLKLQCLPKLDTLIILGNPVLNNENKGEERSGEDDPYGEDPRMRIIMLVILPNLKRLNKKFVTADELYKANLVKDEIMEQILKEPSERGSSIDMILDYLMKEQVEDEWQKNE